MVLSFKVGIFNSRTTVGTQAVTGVGFTPKALLFFTTGNTSTDTFASDGWYFTGFTTSTSEERAYMFFTYDAVGTGDADSGWNTTFTIGDSTFVDHQIAELSSFDSDGFTLNWTDSYSDAWRILYIAIGGADITDASVGQFNSPSSTGDSAVTGVGFEPDLVFLIGTNFTADDTFSDDFGTFCNGCFNSAGEQAVFSLISENGVATMDTARYQRVDKCLATFSTTDAATLTHEATFSSMDNDGFTLNYTTASVANKRVAYLALKGLQSKISSFTSPTAGTAPVAQQITGTGFEPQGVIFYTTGKTAGTTIATHNRLSVGMAHLSDEEGCLWYGDENGAASAITAKIIESDNCIRVSDEAGSAGSTTTQALADFTSLDADGFTLNWSVKDASNAYQIIYVALGDAPTAGGGGGARREDSSTMIAPNSLSTVRKKRYTVTSL